MFVILPLRHVQTPGSAGVFFVYPPHPNTQPQRGPGVLRSCFADRKHHLRRCEQRKCPTYMIPSRIRGHALARLSLDTCNTPSCCALTTSSASTPRHRTYPFSDRYPFVTQPYIARCRELIHNAFRTVASTHQTSSLIALRCLSYAQQRNGHRYRNQP
jgi:hypothetical protein